VGIPRIPERGRVGNEVVVASEADLKRLIEEHVHPPGPGEECVVCHRLAPREAKDAKRGPRREVLQLSVPRGEEGVLENMWIAIVDKYHQQFPRQNAQMMRNIGLEVVGGTGWKYHVAHFSAYATLMVPELAPVEEGQ
jgi:hypothetical protein